MLEQNLLDERFVPNDTVLGGETQVALITGPNMAGKSTYLRQVAIIALMAHTGGFVPAAEARIVLIVVRARHVDSTQPSSAITMSGSGDVHLEVSSPRISPRGHAEFEVVVATQEVLPGALSSCVVRWRFTNTSR